MGSNPIGDTNKKSTSSHLESPNTLCVMSKDSLSRRDMPVYDPAPGSSLLRTGCTQPCCLYHQRCFSGVAHLHRAYCEWELSHDDPPCNRETFQTLLLEAGFLIVDTMVAGVILIEDFDGVRAYPKLIACCVENVSTI
jgi:hypothetical protein